MTFYPKQPFGPSAPGAAGVRSLAARGGDWQRRRPDANTLAIVQGEFSKIIVSGAEYVSSGKVSPTAMRTAAASRYQAPFVPSVPIQPLVNVEDGQYARMGRNDVPDAAPSFSYTVYPGRTETYAPLVRTNRVAALATSFYGGDRLMGEAVDLQYSSEGSVLAQLVPDLVYVGARTTPQPDKLTAFFGLANFGRTDLANRPLHDVCLYLRSRAGTANFDVQFSAGMFTRAEAEFIPFMGVAATEGYLFALVAERFFRPGPYNPAVNYVPKLWLLVAPKADLTAFNAYDLTTNVFSNAYYPTPTPADGSAPSYYGVLSGVAHDRQLDFTMSLMRIVVLPGNRALVFFPQYCLPAGAPVWRSRVARITLGPSLTAPLVRDKVSAAPTGLIDEYVQSAVHLGEGWVLAKNVMGFGSTELTVKFMLSSDSGSSWFEFNPTGLAAPLKNQFFGDFIVHRSRKDGQNGVVLMPAWDASAQAYFVWASGDNGQSWTRQGLIAKPDAFYRVDSMLAGDGGGNFSALVPGPDPSRPADITLPNRYNP